MSTENQAESGPQRITHQISRPTRIIVDLDQIAKNYRLIHQSCNRPLMAVVKADATVMA